MKPVQLTWAAITLVMACPVLAAPRPKPASKVEAELEKMQGTWVYERQTIGGRSLSQDDRDAIWVEIDDKIMTKAGKQGGRLRYKFVLDPAANPKAIDLSSHEHPSGKTFHQKGIYEWDGETLRMCFDNTGSERPKEFASPEGRGNIYLSVLKRKGK